MQLKDVSNALFDLAESALRTVLEDAILGAVESAFIQDLPGTLLPAVSSNPKGEAARELSVESNGHLLPLKTGLEGPEKQLIRLALQHYNGNRKLTAASLNINRSTLFNKMRKYGLL